MPWKLLPLPWTWVNSIVSGCFPASVCPKLATFAFSRLSRVANMAFLKPVFEILPFLNTLGFFWKGFCWKFFGNWKKTDKTYFFWLFFSAKGFILAKRCLSCIFITNLFWRESMIMQRAQQWCRTRGCKGWKRILKSLDLSKIRAKSVKIWEKSTVATSPVTLRWLCDLPRTGCARRTKICMRGANKQ